MQIFIQYCSNFPHFPQTEHPNVCGWVRKSESCFQFHKAGVPHRQKKLLVNWDCGRFSSGKMYILMALAQVKPKADQIWMIFVSTAGSFWGEKYPENFICIHQNEFCLVWESMRLTAGEGNFGFICE